MTWRRASCFSTLGRLGVWRVEVVQHSSWYESQVVMLALPALRSLTCIDNDWWGAATQEPRASQETGAASGHVRQAAAPELRAVVGKKQPPSAGEAAGSRACGAGWGASRGWRGGCGVGGSASYTGLLLLQVKLAVVPAVHLRYFINSLELCTEFRSKPQCGLFAQSQHDAECAHHRAIKLTHGQVQVQQLERWWRREGCRCRPAPGPSRHCGR